MNQKPDYGYSPPVKIPGVSECENPCFKDPGLHRIGIFKDRYHDDGLAGWSCVKKCVGCGRVVGRMFVVADR